MATIKYVSSATIDKKPTVIYMNFTIIDEDPDSKNLIKNMNKKRSDLKKFIQSKNSYKDNSYEQTTINIKRLENRVYFYENETGHIISTEEYNNLPGSSRMEYEKKYRIEFLGFRATLNISAIFNNSDTVVKDFSSLTSMSIKKNIICNYNCGILPEEEAEIDKQLYINCSINGIRAIKDIARGIGGTYYEDKTEIISISDPSSSVSYNADMCYEKSIRTGSMPEEPIVIPELIEDIFNNNISFNKKLEIMADIKNI